MAELRTHRDLTERGESALVGALLPLPASFVVLPQLILPGHNWQQPTDDTDVVVLGPSGAALLAYHNWQGTISAVPGAPSWRLRFPGGGEEARANPALALAQKADALADFLAARGVAPALLATALVFPDRSIVQGETQVPTLTIRTVASWLGTELGASSSDPAWIARAADQLRPPSPARLVNQYQIMAVHQRDSDHIAYLAFDTLASKTVILRELAYDPYQDPATLDALRKELLREAKLTMQLEHAGVVQVERVIPKDDRYYVVSEYVEGSVTLRSRLDQTGALPPPEALSIAIQIASALAHAHGKGIIHRDVRPENILLAAGVAKLSGFGLAKKAELGTRPTFDLRKLATESPYCAPESRLGHEGHHRADARADVYSLGVVAYEMLTGQLPAHLDEKYWEPPGHFSRDIAPELDDTIAQALRFDPIQRLPTMNALRERLLQVQDHLPEHPDSSRSRYKDRRLIKRTTNSLIYQAHDARLDRQVALKRIVIDPSLLPETRKRQLEAVLLEASAAARLVHPAIVHIVDQFVEDDDGYIVMEWLEGQSLRELLETHGGHLPTEQVLDLVTQIASALAYAHEHGVVHRDIKPENVMVHHGRVTVLDFGIAAVAGSIGASGPAGDPPSSRAGTARYIAPEILKGESFDGRSDVFSLGVTLYEALTGRYPFAPEVILGHYAPHLLEPGVESASSLNVEVSAELGAIVNQAIAVELAERFESADALLSALDRSRGRGGGAGRRLPGVWAILLGVVVAAAIGAGSVVVLAPLFAPRPAPAANPMASSSGALAPGGTVPGGPGDSTGAGLPIATPLPTLLPAVAAPVASAAPAASVAPAASAAPALPSVAPAVAGTAANAMAATGVPIAAPSAMPSSSATPVPSPLVDQATTEPSPP